MMLQAGLTLVTVKLFFLGLLFFFTSPAATHALAKACNDARRRAAARRTGAHAIEALIVNVLLTLLASYGRHRDQRNLFAVVILGSIYSFLMATALVVLDAVDVAMTEASVGAGISTVLLLARCTSCTTTRQKPRSPALLPLSAHIVMAAVLVYGTLDLPPFSDPAAPIHTPCRAALPRRLGARDRRPERRDLGARELPRLRHARRDDGDLHRRHRRASRCCAGAGETDDERGHAMSLDLILRVGTKILSVHPAVRALCPVPRRLRPGRRLPGRRHRRRGDHLLRHHLRPRRRAHRARAAGRDDDPARRADLCRRRRRGHAPGRQLPRLFVLAHDPRTASELGIFLVEVGVFVTVSGTMLAMFYAFAGAPPDGGDE